MTATVLNVVKRAVPVVKKTVHFTITYGKKDKANAIWLKLSWWRGLGRGALPSTFK